MKPGSSKRVEQLKFRIVKQTFLSTNKATQQKQARNNSMSNVNTYPTHMCNMLTLRWPCTLRIWQWACCKISNHQRNNGEHEQSRKRAILQTKQRRSRPPHFDELGDSSGRHPGEPPQEQTICSNSQNRWVSHSFNFENHKMRVFEAPPPLNEMSVA